MMLVLEFMFVKTMMVKITQVLVQHMLIECDDVDENGMTMLRKYEQNFSVLLLRNLGDICM